jgi:hypothetical protein
MLVSAILFGCGVDCDRAAIPGHYQITQDSHEYQLDLRADGKGTFTFKQDESSLASLTWEIERSTGQVLLNVSSEALDVLRRLAAAAPPPPGTVQTRSGYFAVSPKCTWGRQVGELDLDEDGIRSFERISAN